MIQSSWVECQWQRTLTEASPVVSRDSPCRRQRRYRGRLTRRSWSMCSEPCGTPTAWRRNEAERQREALDEPTRAAPQSSIQSSSLLSVEKSDFRRSGFVSCGDTKAVFHTDGNRPTADDRFAMWLILANSESHALTTNKSSGDVLTDADLMRRFISAGVVGTRDVKNHVGMTRSGAMTGSVADLNQLLLL